MFVQIVVLSVRMRLLLLFVSLLPVALTKSPIEVSGYLGESVTLPSGADPPYNISTIEWSIFPNTTWIATNRNNRKNINWFWQYAGRLNLDISSGDLMINNLTRADATEYVVEIKNTEKNTIAQRVKLVVKQHLQKPKLQTLVRASEDEGCWTALRCSSPDEGVEFSWQVHPPTSAVFLVVPHGDASIILASINNSSVSVRFTCAASKKVENASSVLTESCRVPHSRHPEDERIFELAHTQCKHGAYCLLGFVLGAALSLVIYLLREKINIAWKYVKGEKCQSTKI